MAVILVVDDETGIRELLSEILEDEGHTVELAANAAQARAVRQRITPGLVLLDIWMPDTDGVTLLKEWMQAGLLTMPVIMMSGHGTIDHAVEATRIGAVAFLEKPITMAKLLKAVGDALDRNAIGGSAAARLAAEAASRSANAQAGGGAESTRGAGGDMGGSPAAAGGAGAASHDAVPAHHVMTVGHRGASVAGSEPNPAFSGSVIELDLPLREARDEFERVYFEFHLARESGSMTRVAEKTGLERTHLYRKLKQLGVDIPRASGRRQAAPAAPSTPTSQAAQANSSSSFGPPSTPGDDDPVPAASTCDDAALDPTAEAGLNPATTRSQADRI